MLSRTKALNRTAVVVDEVEETSRALADEMRAVGFEVIATVRDLAMIDVLPEDLGLLVVASDLETVSTYAVARSVSRYAAPILFVTTGEPDFTQLGELDGAFAFLGKPFATPALRATVETLRIQHSMRARLRTLEKHYQALFEHAAVGVAQVDVVTGRVVDANLTCAGICATTVEQMIDTDFFGRVRIDQREGLRHALGELGNKRRPYAAALEIRRDDGEDAWVRITATPLTGEASHHVLILEDITERERFMVASREAAERERVAHAANRAKTDFLAHMSHELRTPLNAVLGLSEALIESTFGKLNEGQEQALATIHGSGRHLLDLINDVLDIARVESGHLPVEMQQISLRSLLEESAALVHAQLAIKAQRLVLDFAPSIPLVDADHRRMKQVLLNVLGNAVKFSGVGTTVTIRVAVVDDEVSISIEDSGPGIARDDLERIFEPFVRVDSPETRNYDGAGLGLALVKRIVELHRGRVNVSSVLGHGSKFTITLPCSSTGTATLPAKLPRLVPPTLLANDERPIALLAEDNEATVFAVRAYLEHRGYKVRTVRDGLSAYEVALDPTIAAVLMDIRLHGLDGLEATRRIRAHPGSSKKPIIALTAHAMPDDEQRCLEAGASAYLAKPVSLGALVVLIEQLLEVRA